MAYCDKCGYEFGVEANFCPKCGDLVDEAERNVHSTSAAVKTENNVDNNQKVLIQKWKSLILPFLIYTFLTIAILVNAKADSSIGMALLFFSFIFGSLLLFILGIIRPALVVSWGNSSRSTVTKSYLLPSIIIVVFLIITNAFFVDKEVSAVEKAIIGKWQVKYENIKSTDNMLADLLVNSVIKGSKIQMTFFKDGKMYTEGNIVGMYRGGKYGRNWLEKEEKVVVLYTQEDSSDKVEKAKIKIMTENQLGLFAAKQAVVTLNRI